MGNVRDTDSKKKDLVEKLVERLRYQKRCASVGAECVRAWMTLNCRDRMRVWSRMDERKLFSLTVSQVG